MEDVLCVDLVVGIALGVDKNFPATKSREREMVQRVLAMLEDKREEAMVYLHFAISL